MAAMPTPTPTAVYTTWWRCTCDGMATASSPLATWSLAFVECNATRSSSPLTRPTSASNGKSLRSSLSEAAGACA
eukprot:3362247-Pleurochrysis_carterae.AAC.2